MLIDVVHNALALFSHMVFNCRAAVDSTKGAGASW